MPSLVALGAILMVAGGVLVLLQRKHTPRLRLSNIISADGIGDLDPLFTQIGQIDTARGRLDQAIDGVIPVRTGQSTASTQPTRADVVRAYAVARDRLVAFSDTYLHRPPSDPVTRFAALSRCVDETLALEEAPEARRRTGAPPSTRGRTCCAGWTTSVARCAGTGAACPRPRPPGAGCARSSVS